MKYAFHKEASWIRIGNWLFHAKRSAPLFSERNGYVKFFPIGFGWRVRISREKLTT